MKVKEIDFNRLKGSKDSSREYIASYGNEEIVPFFETLYNKPRTPESDKLVLNHTLYIIGHCEKFGKNETPYELKRSLFNICKNVTFLSSQIISGSSDAGIVDKYTIRNKTGFEDCSIFKDLKYLQKVFDPRIKQVDSDSLNVLEDIVGSLKNIINLELGDKLEDEKEKKRKDFLDVAKYPNIFTVAAFNRENERLEIAKESLRTSIKTLDNLNYNLENPKDDYIYLKKEHAYLDSNDIKKCIFAVLRAVIITGEFASQKNFTLQTRINSPEITDLLQQIKRFTDQIVKPSKFGFGTKAIIDEKGVGITNTHIDSKSLSKQLEELLKSLEILSQELSKSHKESNYCAKVKYYTSPQEPQKPYLSEELIKKMYMLIRSSFKDLDEEQLKNINQILLNPEKAQYIAEITNQLKIFNKNYPKTFHTELKKGDKSLVEQIKNFQPEPSSPIFLVSEIEKLLDLLKDKSDVASIEGIKQAIKDFFDTLKSLLSSEIGDLPKPMECDNPIAIKINGLYVSDIGKKWALIMDIPIRLKEAYKMKVIESDDATYSRSDIGKAVKSIGNYAKSEMVMFPKSYFGKGGAFVSKFESNQQTLKDFEGYIFAHQQEVYEYIINYGKFCNLCHFINNAGNKLSLEFLLQTGYNLIKKKCELEGKETTLFPPEEYRALRHALRHFEDNMDVTETPVQIEEMYAHYAARLLGESEIPEF